MQGFFFSFEGPDCAGKTTQIQLLTQYLNDKGFNVYATREPGGTRIGEEIRKLVKFLPEEDAACLETEILLFSASRAQLVRKVIAPKLRAGHIVIADRFIDSTTVYQAYANGLPLEKIMPVHEIAVGEYMPLRTFLLDLPIEQARQRNTARTDVSEATDRFEARAEVFHRKVREGYLTLAKQFPQRIIVIDATGTIESIQARIREEIDRVLT